MNAEKESTLMQTDQIAFKYRFDPHTVGTEDPSFPFSFSPTSPCFFQVILRPLHPFLHLFKLIQYVDQNTGLFIFGQIK